MAAHLLASVDEAITELSALIDGKPHDGLGAILSGAVETLTHMPPVLQALRAFCVTIEATGGVVTLTDGMTAPLGDPEWIDLGNAYLEACAALGLSPKEAE